MSSDSDELESETFLLEDQGSGDEWFIEPSIESRHGPYNLKEILPAIWLGSFLSAMDGTLVANIMSGIAAEFGQEDMKSWVATSYLLTNTAFQPLYGKVSDVIGRKNALLISQFFFALGCFLSFFAANIQQLAISRAISGIGGGGIVAMASIILSDILSLEDRGIFQGYANINYTAGQMLGPPIGGFALATIGWRWAFGFQVPALAVCSFLTYKNINIPTSKPFTVNSLGRIDFGGALALVSSIGSLLLISSTDLNKVMLVIIFTLSTLGFFLIEKYVAREHLIPLDLFEGTLGVCAILSLVANYVLYCLLFSVPVYLQVVQGQNPKESSVFLIVCVLFVAVGSVIAGWVLRRFSDDIKRASNWISFFSSSFILFGNFIIWLVFLIPRSYSPGLSWKLALFAGLATLGFSFGHLMVSILITTVALVGKDGQAAATGVNYLFRSVGQVFGVGLSLSLYENTVHTNLSKLLKDTPNGDKILKKLTSNADYLKTSDLIGDSLKQKILLIYQHSMTISYVSSVLLAASAVVMTFVLVYRRDR